MLKQDPPEETEQEFFSRLHKERIYKNEHQKSQFGATWYGTGFLHVYDDESGILIDPFVTTVPAFSIMTGKKLVPDAEKIRKFFEQLKHPVDAIIVTHTHYDHAMDAYHFAQLCKCPVYGSDSLDQLMQSHNYKDTNVVESNKVIDVGNQKVTFIKSEHGISPNRFFTWNGKITAPLTLPAPASAYQKGTVFSLHIKTAFGSYVHHASAGFQPDMYANHQADIVFLGIALRPETKSYMSRIFSDLQPQTIIPIHYDDFLFRPNFFQALPTVNFKEFIESMNAQSQWSEKYKLITRKRDISLF